MQNEELLGRWHQRGQIRRERWVEHERMCGRETEMFIEGRSGGT